MMEQAPEPVSDSLAHLFRELPSVHELLIAEPIQILLRSYARGQIVQACRTHLEVLRMEIALGNHSRDGLKNRIAELPSAIEKELRKQRLYSLRPVINATGVLLHTNLGRALLSREAMQHVTDIACGYCNLEFDLETGARGKRDIHTESLLLDVLQSKAGVGRLGETYRALIVNNCAAAAFLALHALAKGQEVLVSRGELVEIGGGFRIPEILQASGAVLREVGTTNRTRIADYERAITPNSALILRVHQSNFSMQGFVERPGLEGLMELGRRLNVPVFHDQGTGLVESLDSYGISGESTIVSSIRAQCDLIAASGDKLFGGPQCGILLGTQPMIDRIRQNPLFRTYRVDKLGYAALEATLHQYLENASGLPVLKMLATSVEEIGRRCLGITEQVSKQDLTAEVVEVASVLGGGTAPTARVRSCAISLKHCGLNSDELVRVLRGLDPPVIGRIEGGRVLLDLRTVDPASDSYLARELRRIAAEEPRNLPPGRNG
ncbi:L-seryl-tRNA(Sec) selenium transferase [Acidobacteria bacterium AB60]|nr:L-seryl-tRNA(Sec) selenium transferase [Acidobacteria bacterium AB60]